jgi:hypothetical protein
MLHTPSKQGMHCVTWVAHGTCFQRAHVDRTISRPCGDPLWSRRVPQRKVLHIIDVPLICGDALAKQAVHRNAQVRKRPRQIPNQWQHISLQENMPTSRPYQNMHGTSLEAPDYAIVSPPLDVTFVRRLGSLQKKVFRAMLLKDVLGTPGEKELNVKPTTYCASTLLLPLLVLYKRRSNADLHIRNAVKSGGRAKHDFTCCLRLRSSSSSGKSMAV